MKKLVNVIRNMFLTIGVFLFSASTKVFGMDSSMIAEYGISKPEPKPTKSFPFGGLDILKFFVIPIAFIIGAIIYFKKSKSDTQRKIIIILIALVLLVLVCFAVEYIHMMLV